jgi:hypothetical protein
MEMESLMALLQTLYYVFIGLMIFQVVCMWFIYTKAGQPGWGSLIPFYNLILLMRIIGKKDFAWLKLLIPIYGIVVAIQFLHGLSKAFGKGVGFTLLLLFLPYVGYAILAFGNSTYVLAKNDNGSLDSNI